MAGAEWTVSAAGPCPVCGSSDLRSAPRPIGRRMLDWFRFGRTPAGMDVECARCGDRSSGGIYAVLRRARTGWWWWPVDFVRVIRNERSMEPVPATYAMALAVGVLLGVAAQLALGVPWWLIAAGFVAAVWAFFMSTALWGGVHGRRAVLRMISPRRAARHDVHDLAKAMRGSDRPLYGVEGWPGELSLGGMAGSTRHPNGFWLRHGDPPERGAPCVEVSVFDPEGRPDGRPHRGVADQVAHWNRPHGAPRPRHGPDPVWGTKRFVVDGAEFAFAFLAAGAAWAAVRTVGPDEIRIVARDVPPENVRLAMVTDLTPYVEGDLRRIAHSRPSRHAPWR